MKNDKAGQLEIVADNEDVISINDRKRLDEIKKQYPKIQIIVGGKDVMSKKSIPVTIDLAEMEACRLKIIDAATESIYGTRMDRLDTSGGFPLPAVMFLVGFLVGVSATFFAYTI